MFHLLKSRIVLALAASTLVACAPTAIQSVSGTRPTVLVETAEAKLTDATAPTATAIPLPQATSMPAPVSRYQGFVVYEEASGKFASYDFQGKPLGFTVDAGPLSVGRSPDEAQVVNNALYYRGEDQKIIRADARGSRQLDGIPPENLSVFKVSPDEKLIAWTSNQWNQVPAHSDLWLANLDGSQARQVMTSTTAANGEFFTITPYGWTGDGRLLIVKVPTGIGGYILYRAYSTLQIFDPQTGEIKSLYQPETGFRMCLSGITSDLTRLGFVCDDSGAGKVNIRAVADGRTTMVPNLPEQNVAGSMRFSPSGGWLAYAIARRNPDHERGQVAVVPVDASSAPISIASQEGGFYDVIDWIDEDTLLLFLTRDGQGSIWRVNRDGSNLTQLATGSYVVGLLSAPAS